MIKKQAEQYKKKLFEKRKELTKAFAKNREYGRESDVGGSQDLADKASSSYAKEVQYSLSNTERRILEEIAGAIDRMEEGEYGTCMDCEDRITKKRLDAVPWARYCVPCQERIEQGIQEEITD